MKNDGTGRLNMNNGLGLALFFIILNTSKQLYLNYYFVFGNYTLKSSFFNLLLTTLMTLIFFGITFRIKSRWFLAVLYLLQSLYFLLNITYFEYFKNYLYFGTITSNFTEGFITASHKAIPLYLMQSLVLMDLPVILLLLTRKQLYPISLKFFSACGLLLGVLLGTAWYQAKMPWQIYHNNAGGTSAIIQKYGLLSLQTTDLFISYNTTPKFNYGPLVYRQKELSSHPNIIQIQIESLDASILGKTYKGELVAPFLTKLSTEAIYYPYTLSYHLGGASTDSEFSIINGVEPLQNTNSLKLTRYTFDNSFVKVLRDNGYQTLAFHNNDENYYNRGYAFRQMGYKDFFDMKKMGLNEAVWGASDSDLFKYVANKIQYTENPFFYHVITISSHEPFIFIPNYHNPHFDDIADVTTRNYFNSIQYVDREMKFFFETASLQNTYIVLYGDHTSSIKSSTYTSSSFIERNQKFEFVPLIIVTPQKQKYHEKNTVASFLDVGLTILNLSGVPYSYRSNGEDLIAIKGQKSKINFLDETFDRNKLFKKINAYVH